MEDSPILRDFVVEAIAENEKTTVVGYADTESDAIEGVMKFKPDVVIIDIKLRVGNGINVLRQIKKMKLFGSMVAIVLTNYAFDIYQKRCMALGADYFLDKSTQFEQLKQILGRLAQVGKA